MASRIPSPAVIKCLSAAALSLLAESPAWSATAPGSANLNLYKPLALAKTNDLDFGAILPPATGTGTIRIDPNSGAATYVGASVAGARPTSRATFTGQASRLSLVVITIPSGNVILTRVGGTQTLTANNFTLDNSGWLRLVGTTPFTIGVGATLSVPSTAVDGSYVGTFSITADYY